MSSWEPMEATTGWRRSSLARQNPAAIHSSIQLDIRTTSSNEKPHSEQKLINNLKGINNTHHDTSLDLGRWTHYRSGGSSCFRSTKHLAEFVAWGLPAEPLQVR